MGRPKKDKTEDDRLEIRISSDAKEKLQAYAEEKGTTKSEVLREHIDSLPDPRDKEK
jgi:predicted DNA-binding protein